MALTRWTKAMEWLAAAAEDPQAYERDCRRGGAGIHLLAAGRLWDVLIVPACLGLRAADMLDDLPRVGPGPVLLDGRRREVGFFLPPDPGATWVGDGTRHITQGGWIAAPAPHCRWGDLRWLVPPDGSGALTTPRAMELALHRATRELVRCHGTPTHTGRSPHRRADGTSTAIDSTGRQGR
ncbi:hypothetical protein [Streptomyces sp. NBC_00105]|uniref:hypothetical protein n=1 Tax=Streptomyces sp. NBC_00105 TaxID=2903622 RepID=UPI002F90EFF2